MIERIKFAGFVILADALVAAMVALAMFLIVLFTGLPPFLNGAIIETPDGLGWIDLRGFEGFDPEIRKMPIVVGRAHVFLLTIWSVAFLAIPVIFVVIDLFIFPITGAQQIRWRRQGR